MEKEDILNLTPELPKSLNDKLKNLFAWENYMFVWTDNGVKKGYCTACQTKQILSLEQKREYSYDDSILLSKKHNQICKCPNCKLYVTYKDKNRGRKKLHKENYVYIVQGLSNGGIIIRSFYVRQNFVYNIENELELSEHHRIYLFDGEAYRYQREINYLFKIKEDYYSSDNNYFVTVSKISTPKPTQGRICGYFGGIEKTIIDDNFYSGQFRYSQFADFIKEHGSKNIIEYLNLYNKNPILIEKLMKEGFDKLVYRKFHEDTRGIINWKATTVAGALKLNKGEIKQLKTKQLNEIVAKQFINRYNISKENSIWLYCYFKSSCDAKTLISEMQKLIALSLPNKMIKYLRIQNISIYDYNDYLLQLEKLNIPKTESSLFPAKFIEEHNKLTAEIQKRRNEKKKAELEQQEKEFEKTYKKLYSQLYYSDNDLFIIPAKGDSDLLTESTALGHCVYSCYRDKYKKGQTIILLIRKKAEPDKPFYTLELNKNYNQIIQCRGLKNCGTTAEVEAFKNKWFELLQKGQIKECQKQIA